MRKRASLPLLVLLGIVALAPAVGATTQRTVIVEELGWDY